VIDALNRDLLLLRENRALLRAAHNYDILDPATGNCLMECREERLGRATRLLRYTSLKRTTPFDLRVRTPDGQPVLRMTRGIPVFASHVSVFDEGEALIGSYRQKPFSIAGVFDVVDAEDQPVCRLDGGPIGRHFRFRTAEGIELARVARKWSGLGREFLTGVDDFTLEIHEAVPRNSVVRRLILASVLCVGLIQKIDLP
jgi:hypothetical protein